MAGFEVTTEDTALRISDIATLARDRVNGGRIIVRTMKTGQPVLLRIWPETQTAMEALPPPRGSGMVLRHYFWNGTTSKRAVVASQSGPFRPCSRHRKYPAPTRTGSGTRRPPTGARGVIRGSGGHLGQ